MNVVGSLKHRFPRSCAGTKLSGIVFFFFFRFPCFYLKFNYAKIVAAIYQQLIVHLVLTFDNKKRLKS